MKKDKQSSTTAILLICRRAETYATLIEVLSHDYLVAICTKFESIQDKIERDKYSLFIIEHTLNENIVMKVLDFNMLVSQRGSRVILLDGQPKKEFIAAAFARGLCDYFPAPVQHELLVERVHSLVKETASTISPLE